MSALALPVSAVRAHGREPMLGAITFDPNDRSHIVVRATWTLLESHDDGASFVWRCAAVVGYDRTTEDPPVAVAEGGEIFAGTFDGIVHGGRDSCAWSLVEDEDAAGEYAIELERDPSDAGTIWALLSPGATDNRLVRTTDGGANWDVVGVPRGGEPTLLVERMALSPSDPLRVYVSGATPATATMLLRRAFSYRSDDGGATFIERELPLESGERNAHVLGVDPTNADRVFMRMTRPVADETPERLLLSEDGGETWTVAASLLEITGLAISDDGAHVWVGSWDGGFLRSDAAGAPGTFVPVSTAPDLRVRCLSWRSPSAGSPGELWVCVDDIVEPFALARSTDLGQTLVPVWSFENASPETGCARCSEVGLVCSEHWADVIFDLGLRLDAGPGLDAATLPGRDAGLPLECLDGAVLEMDVGPDTGTPATVACGCRATRAELPATVLLSIAVVLLAARRRARRTAARPV